MQNQNLNFLNKLKTTDTYTSIKKDNKIIAIIPLNCVYNIKTNKVTKGYIVIVENLNYLVSYFLYQIKMLFLFLFIAFLFVMIISLIFFYTFFVKKYIQLLKLIPTDKKITTFDLMFINIDKIINNQKKAIKNLVIMSKVIQNSNDAIAVTDKNYNIIYINKSFKKLIKIDLKEIKNKNIFHLLNINEKEIKNLEIALFYEITFKTKENKKLNLLVSLIPIYTNNKISNYAFIIKDVTKIKEKQKEIEKLAFYDPLTNLGNRYLFNKKLEELINIGKTKNISFAVFIMDI